MSISTPEKDHLNSLLKIELASLHHDIATCETPSDLATFGDLLTIQLSKFCRDQEQYFPNQINTHNKPFINHENKTIQQLVTCKKELRKKTFSQSGTKEDRKKFHDCLKAINELKKIESEKVISKTALHQEKSCNKNHRKFSKKVINCSLNTPEQQVGFSLDEGNVYYPRTYAHPPPLESFYTNLQFCSILF